MTEDKCPMCGTGDRNLPRWRDAYEFLGRLSEFAMSEGESQRFLALMHWIEVVTDE